LPKASYRTNEANATGEIIESRIYGTSLYFAISYGSSGTASDIAFLGSNRSPDSDQGMRKPE
jgi:hypothetical protein